MNNQELLEEAARGLGFLSEKPTHHIEKCPDCGCALRRNVNPMIDDDDVERCQPCHFRKYPSEHLEAKEAGIPVMEPRTATVPFVYDDGGREAAGFKGKTDDCFCRAVSIAFEMPYQEVYDLINEVAKRERKSKRKSSKSSARTGVYTATAKRVMEQLSCRWVSVMGIGTGCKMHLCNGEVPSKGRMVLRLSKHFCALVDGEIHDTHDPSRDGTRCVYGYWVRED